MGKFIFIGVLLFFTSCTPKITEVIETSEPITYPTTEIAQGKGLYDSKCSSCHKLKTVNNYSSEQWAEILPKMAKKAKLPDNETKSIQEFISWKINN